MDSLDFLIALREELCYNVINFDGGRQYALPYLFFNIHGSLG